jgi:CheY-like chemotaxis protein
MSILIVDDSQDELLLLSSLLEKSGYKSLLTADSADDAFRKLGLDGCESPVSTIDLVLMDIVMPHTDGLEACTRIRSHPQLYDLPIIVITVKSDPEDLRAAFTAGASDFIRKPVNAVELVARVSTALTLREEREWRREREEQLVERTDELEQALRQVKVLRGLIPICSKCKGVRNEQGYWQRIEEYIQDHSEAQFTHGLCEACMRELYPQAHAELTGQPSARMSSTGLVTDRDQAKSIDAGAAPLPGTPRVADKAPARKARRVLVHCRLLMSGENIASAEGQVLDLSTAGCKAESSAALSKGMELTIKLMLPDHEWELKIERAVVRWVEGRTFGLEFLGIRPAQRERMRLFLAKVDK